MPKLAHPEGCRGCSLDERGEGFAPAEGPAGSWLLLVGEALGYTEALMGRPFVGDAGGMLSRLLNLLGWNRDAIRIHNTISCFPGDTVVQANEILRGYRRWYEGEWVTVETRAGILSGTPNHPVLTQQGWVALGELHGGDYLVRGALDERMPGSDPDVEHRPAPFAQLFDALAKARIARRVVGCAVDFHGDGLDGDVDVVATDGVLGVDTLDAIGEEGEQLSLNAADRPAVALLADRAPPCGRALRGPHVPPRRAAASASPARRSGGGA
jgi:hypothetical protein